MATLQSSVDGIEAPTDYSSDLADLASGLATAQTSIDSLTAQLENFDGNAAELNTISSTLAQVAADVKELLGNNAVVNSDIIITNTAQLVLAESLVNTQTDAPNVIVNGDVRVEFTNTNLTADERTRAQAVLNKVATIVGHDLILSNSASPTTAMALPNLTFVDGSVSINTNDASLPKLVSVSKAFTVNYPGAINYPALASIGSNFTITTAQLGAITSIDLSGVTIGGNLIAPNTGIANLPKATTAHFGTASVVSATLSIATDIDLGHTDDLASLYISAPKADTIDIATDEIMGTLQILGTDDTVFINLPNLTIAGSTSVSESSELNLNKLAGFNGTAVIESDAVNIPELSTNVTGTLTFTEATTLNFPKLTLAGMLDGQKAETLTFKSGVNTNLTTTTKAKSITIVEQGNTTNFDASTQTILETLNVTGKVNESPNIANVTSEIMATNTTLKSVSIDGMINAVIISGTSALTSFSTAGNIRNLVLDDADALVSATIGHGHIDGSDAAQITVTNNLKLAALATTVLDEVGHINISTNAALASLDLSSMITLPQFGSFNVSITGNKFTGDYDAATAATTTTAYIDTQIKSNDLFTLVPYITKSAASSIVTYVFAALDLSDVDPGTPTQTLQAAIAADTDGIAEYASSGGSRGVTSTLTEKDFVRLVKSE